MINKTLVKIFSLLFFLFSTFQISALADENVVIKWNNALLQAVSTTKTSPPVVARALAIVHTCIYDAWAAYDAKANDTIFGGGLRRPVEERTGSNKITALSFAAYRALVDLFPTEKNTFDELMESLDLKPSNKTTDITTPEGIGNVIAENILVFRHSDGSNQLGDITTGAYSDYTGYAPVNTADEIFDPNRWQPLLTAAGTPQKFLLPQWGMVIPFALRSPDELRPPPPAQYPSPIYKRQVQELLRFSAYLDDRTKMIVEYWADGPNTVTPPGHWNLLAQTVSKRDNHTVDDDVKMFFALGNALLDASIAVWESKVFYDYVRPVTAIHFLIGDKIIIAWGGPGKSIQPVIGNEWRSYISTPPFSEYVSGHSTFSAASAEILKLFTGSDFFGQSVRLPAGSSVIEPGKTPEKAIVLSWPTFLSAANEAGLSRRLGGIHFRQADFNARRLGREIGNRVWTKASNLFDGKG